MRNCKRGANRFRLRSKPIGFTARAFRRTQEPLGTRLVPDAARVDECVLGDRRRCRWSSRRSADFRAGVAKRRSATVESTQEEAAESAERLRKDRSGKSVCTKTLAEERGRAFSDG